MTNNFFQLEQWSKASLAPGQFTGSTGAQVLSQEELSTSAVNTWATIDFHKNTKPIEGGIGMHLIKKMGWKDGQGLGKESQGLLQPILPIIKLDTKGLASFGEKPKQLALQIVQKPNNINDMLEYPVSTLNSFCVHKRYSCPVYELVEESGPPHKKQFLMRVKVNDYWYQPTIRLSTKKQAKHLTATVCLQAFGLLPKDPPRVHLRVDNINGPTTSTNQ